MKAHQFVVALMALLEERLSKVRHNRHALAALVGVTADQLQVLEAELERFENAYGKPLTSVPLNRLGPMAFGYALGKGYAPF